MARARVLVVEDEGIIGLDLEARLSRLGYEVTAVVASGLEAVRLAAETRPDVVLMDMVIKGPLQGEAAAAEIRQRLGIPVIYLTAHGGDAFPAGTPAGYGYIAKPYEEGELKDAIERVLEPGAAGS